MCVDNALTASNIAVTALLAAEIKPTMTIETRAIYIIHFGRQRGSNNEDNEDNEVGFQAK